jgi:hypothetical protein
VHPSDPPIRPERHERLLALYGKQLIGIRHRGDAPIQRRIKTVALIVEESSWHPKRGASKAAMMVGLCVDFQEVALQRRVQLAGGR